METKTYWWSNSDRDFGRKPEGGGNPQSKRTFSLFVPMAQWSKGGGRSDIEGHPDGMKHWEKQWREIGDRRLRKEGEGEKKSCMHLDERD